MARVLCGISKGTFAIPCQIFARRLKDESLCKVNVLRALRFFKGFSNGHQVTHMCVNELCLHWFRYSNILSPSSCQSITWTHVGTLSFGQPGTDFGEVPVVNVNNLFFSKIHGKMPSSNWWLFCPSIDGLKIREKWIFVECRVLDTSRDLKI